MLQPAGHILKGDNVTVEGRFHLDLDHTSVQPAPSKGSASATPQVRILENTPTYAVLGITCSCGAEMSIRCDYAETQAAEAAET